MASVCAKTVLAPFDTIKTVQQRHRDVGSASSPLTLLQAARLVTSRGNGLLELYAGLGVAALGSVPSVGLYFGIYSYSKGALGPLLADRFSLDDDVDGALRERRARLLRTVAVAASAAIGNTVASFSRVPFEVLKQRLQADANGAGAGGALRALRSALAEGGQGALFPPGSVRSQMARDVPYAVCTLLAYERLREDWIDRAPDAAPWRDVVAGAVAGGLGSYITNPLDVIKTRLQIDGGVEFSGGVIDCARRTWTEEGPGAFLKGSVPRLIHKVPANAIFFFSYELFRRALRAEGTSSNRTTSGGGTDEHAGKSKLKT